MIKLYRKNEDQISFTKENKEQFENLLTEIYEILRDSAYKVQANWIIQILSAVQKEDSKLFKQKVISSELLGGAGSVIDVWIDEKDKMKKLNSIMKDFLDLTVKSGLNHRAVKSSIKLFSR